MARAAPDVVFHLAARADVPASWKDPETTLTENVATTLNLLDAVRSEAPEATVVSVSSGEVYGPPASLPVGEDAPIRPQNPYAVSKVAGDALGGLYADAHGLRVIRARAFNHAGPGQSDRYAISAFARQFAEGEIRGDRPVRIVTGNPDSRRDYTDVRDVVSAYRLLAEHAEPGVYNVCSGRSRSARELIALMGEALGREIDHVVDETRLRPHEVMEIRGAPDRLSVTTGWRPRIPLKRTLADTAAWWRERVAAGAGAPS